MLDHATPVKRVNGQPLGIPNRGAVVERTRRRDVTVRRGRQHFPTMQGTVPRGKVSRRRANRAGRERVHMREWSLVLEPLGAHVVAVRLPRDDGGFAAVTRIRHPRFVEEVLLDVSGVALARRFLNNQPSQKVCRVGIELKFAWLEVERQPLKHRDQRIPWERARSDVAELWETRVVLHARRVVEQLPHRDGVPLRRIVGEILGDVIGERQLPGIA